jgi:sugar O-acyltransferase (sialic acid O-acetyltransferase NeuD family)
MNQRQKLVLLGMGGNCSDIADAVEEINALEPTYDLLGYLASSPRPKESLKYLGDFSEARKLPEDLQLVGFTFGPGSYLTWPATVASLGLPPERFATIIHPRACVSPRATVGRGSVILAGTTVGADVRIGQWVIILQNVTLGHDDVIGDYTCITSGAAFSGGVRVGRNCYIGTHATIVNGVQIGDQSLIGAGTLIRHDVPAREVWVGNPGRRLRPVSEP